MALADPCVIRGELYVCNTVVTAHNGGGGSGSGRQRKRRGGLDGPRRGRGALEK